MRLIDADALIRKLCAKRDEVQIEHACDIGYHNGLNMAVSMTINAPTVDAVEAVRCKDCKNYGDEYFCPLRNLADYTDPNDYCSMGERREDDG